MMICIAAPVSAQNPGDIIGRAARVYRSLASLQADFEQVIDNPMIDSAESKGTLVQSGDARLAMRFTDPPGEAIVIDGRNVWVYTPSTVRDEEALYRDLGRELRVVVALHDATGEIAGLTEVAVRRDPRRSDQEDTAVVPAHRGSGLGLWVKADMLVRLQDERPDVAEILTGNAFNNPHMLRINTRLGFRPYVVLQEWQADVRTLADRLAAQPA